MARDMGDADGSIARDRCLAAMVGADVETRRALLRAARRYDRKRLTGAAEDVAQLPPLNTATSPGKGRPW